MPRFTLTTSKTKTKTKGTIIRAWLKEGRKIHASKQGFKTIREAKEWAGTEETRILQEEERAKLAATSGTLITFLVASNDYLSWGDKRWERNTYIGKRGIYKRFLSFLKENHPNGIGASLGEVTSVVIEQYMFWVADLNRCSTKTSNRHRREIGAVFNHAIKRGILDGIVRVKQHIDNPCHDIEEFAENEYSRPVPTFETVELYRGEAQGDEADYIELMCNTLQRGRSIRRLRWSEVNFADDRAGYRHKKREGGGDRIVWIHMNPTVKEILRRRFKGRETASPYVFVNKTSGGRLKRSCSLIKNLFKTIRKRLEERLDMEVDMITGHALRHWGARMLDEMGVSEKRIGNLLDHQNESTTRIYLDKMRIDQDITEALLSIRQKGPQRPKHLKVVK